MIFCIRSTNHLFHESIFQPVWPHSIHRDSWTKHSRFLRNIVLYSIGLSFHQQAHPQLGVIFTLTHLFILSEAISLLFPNSIVDAYQPGGAHLSRSYLFAYSDCSRGSHGKNAEVFCHSLLQWATFYLNSWPWPVCLGWPCMAWLILSSSYTRLWSMCS